jgi:hypothetical protein
MRVHLLRALESLGLVDEPLRAKLRGTTRRSGHFAMADQIVAFSAALGERYDALLEQYDRVFPTTFSTRSG